MAELFKDKFNPEFFDRFITIVKSAYTHFDAQRFLGLIYDGDWEQREMKQRIRHISMAVRETFPSSYEEALHILTDIAPNCRGFEYLFFPDFVERYGLEHWDTSICALEELTKYSSAEFAVRPFILRDPEKMMHQMNRWAQHPHHHIRRLATEGCRPRLPWAMALNPLKEDPSALFPILDRLKQDPSLYVRKSVANNLNDISKDHPDQVKQIVREWQVNQHPHTDWILKQGCRSLLKKGDVEALRLFGYHLPTNIRIQNLTLSSRQLSLGDTLTFSFDVRNESSVPQKLRIEYGMDFMKANGRLSRKIFHISTRNNMKGTVHVARHHMFQDLTTRKHYKGLHRLSILINGEEKARDEFSLYT